MEFYVMPAFNKIMVKDIVQASKWYERKLGFKSLFKFRNDKNEVIMDHLRLSKYQDIMLIQSNDFTVGNGLRLNLSVPDIEKIEGRLSSNDVVEPKSLQPWNATEITIKDSDGYLITLTQANIENSKSFDSIIQNSSNKYK